MQSYTVVVTLLRPSQPMMSEEYAVRTRNIQVNEMKPVDFNQALDEAVNKALRHILQQVGTSYQPMSVTICKL
ncbi:MAG: hypothetical protein Q8Q32_00310 [bacterium]|nr:hypothetical protein [bacterium]